MTSIKINGDGLKTTKTTVKKLVIYELHLVDLSKTPHINIRSATKSHVEACMLISFMGANRTM